MHLERLNRLKTSFLKNTLMIRYKAHVYLGETAQLAQYLVMHTFD